MGLFLLTRRTTSLAYVVGAGAALLLDRNQSGVKRAFNLRPVRSLARSSAWPSSTRSPSPARPCPARETGSPRSRRAARPAALGAVLVATVISLSGGAPAVHEAARDAALQRAWSRWPIRSLALLAVMVIWVGPALGASLLAVPTAIVFVAYRAYIGEREKHERLELLYESSRLLHYAPGARFGDLGAPRARPPDVPAERAELLLFPDPALDAALRASSSRGVAGPRRWSRSRSPATTRSLRMRTTSRPGVPREPDRPTWTTDPGAVQEAMVGPLVGEHGRARRD